VVAADHALMGTMIFPIIGFPIAAIQLACCIAVLWQWFFGVEDPRFEDDKIACRS
jgi:hypothetical protein